MLTRRVFLGSLAGGLLATPLAAGAQQRGQIPRIGWVGGPSQESAWPFVRAFLEGLRELGWTEGENLAIEWRFADGRAERLPGLVAELIRLRVDLLVVPSTPTALAAKNATTIVPIVTVSVGDPVSLGLVSSLARPGGNITGLIGVIGPEIAGKQLALLKEIVPNVTRMAVLWNPKTPGNAQQVKEAELAARSLGVKLQSVEARSPADFDGAFTAMTVKRSAALLVLTDTMFIAYRNRLLLIAAKSRLPAMYAMRPFVDDGGLVSYGASVLENFRRAATYVDKVLRGAKPADLPIEQPTKFELVINLKTAKALGLTIPPSLLTRADEVIQ